uniref:Zinc finger Ran-binding domain-containing protein 2 n=1 Tax=Cacopsylla melanoneura TaxID=428564 RepID=A0A8D8TCG7_9HEMI
MEAQAARPFKKANEDDWVCADAACGNINFAWRTSCNRCSKEKVGAPSSSSGSSKRKLGHEIGKHIAEKSHGLFSPDDWQCNKCGNVNWARRSQCNMCNAPKFGEVEERTGLGGGYNERGTVEYKQRTKDEDDEYDDFGRRKKPRNPGSSIHSEDSYQGNLGSSKDKNGGDEDEEEEDEEEEGDDEDLSKYDLTGWGDDEEEGGESKEKNGDQSKNKEQEEEEGRSSKRDSGREDGERRRSRSRSRSPLQRN